MPRTRRYIFNTLTVVSLLLVLATVGLWWQSRMSMHAVSYVASSSLVVLQSKAGQCYWILVRNHGLAPVGWTREVQFGDYDIDDWWGSMAVGLCR